MTCGLLVIPEMEEARGIEDFANLFNQVGTHFVICGGRHLPAVLFEPRVVGSGEIQFRYRLQPDAPQTIKFFAEALDIPGSLHRQLGVALVLDSLAKVDNDEVHAYVVHSARYGSPDVFVEPKVVRLTQQLHILALILAVFDERDVGPHVDAHVKQSPPDELSRSAGVCFRVHTTSVCLCGF